MKTLADFKREIPNTKWVLTERFGQPQHEIKEVIHVQSNSIAFKKGDGKSWLELPPASLLEYTGGSFTIYAPGERELTDAEKTILANMPSHLPENREIVERDAVSDGSQSYWMDKRYLTANNANWYWEWTAGQYYNHNTGKMRDKKVKGTVDLKYQKIEN